MTFFCIYDKLITIVDVFPAAVLRRFYITLNRNFFLEGKERRFALF